MIIYSYRERKEESKRERKERKRKKDDSSPATKVVQTADHAFSN